MERTFAKKLKKQLKDRIRGSVYIYIINDTILVEICLYGRLSWQYSIRNLAAQLSTGLSSKIVSDVIVKQYMKYILSEYFY